MYRIIKKDKYGLYIRCGCHIYRPQAPNNNYSYEDIFETKRRGNSTSFNHKDKVKIEDIIKYPYINVVKGKTIKVDSPHSAISKGSINEIWYSHGLYKQGESSELYWRIL